MVCTVYSVHMACLSMIHTIYSVYFTHIQRIVNEIINNIFLDFLNSKKMPNKKNGTVWNSSRLCTLRTSNDIFLYNITKTKGPFRVYYYKTPSANKNQQQTKFKTENNKDNRMAQNTPTNISQQPNNIVSTSCPMFLLLSLLLLLSTYKILCSINYSACPFNNTYTNIRSSIAVKDLCSHVCFAMCCVKKGNESISC